MRRFSPLSYNLVPDIITRNLHKTIQTDTPYVIQKYPNPTEIILNKSAKALEIKYTDEKHYYYSAEYLRVFSNSVEVIGHDGIRKLVFGKKNVKIVNIEAVGNYAIRIIFDDFHNTGIYSFQYLYELGLYKFRKLKSYFRLLKQNGKTREPLKTPKKVS